jgi:hypothetical protein
MFVVLGYIVQADRAEPLASYCQETSNSKFGKGKIVSFCLALICLRGEARQIGRRRGFSARV